MSTYEKIKKERLKAIKEKNELRKNVLTMIVSEMDNKGVARLEGAIQEDAIQKCLFKVKTDLNSLVTTIDKKLEEGIIKVIDEKTQESLDKNKLEQEVVSEFLIEPFTEDEIKATIDGLMLEGIVSFPEIMKEMKSRYVGRYDGKFASTYAKTVAK